MPKACYQQGGHRSQVQIYLSSSRLSVSIWDGSRATLHLNIPRKRGGDLIRFCLEKKSMMRGIILYVSQNMEELYCMKKGDCDEVLFTWRRENVEDNW